MRKKSYSFFVKILFIIIVSLLAQSLLSSSDKLTRTLIEKIQSLQNDDELISVWVYFDKKPINKTSIKNKKLIARLKKNEMEGISIDDIGLKNEYIEILEDIGVRPKFISRWLNAICADLAPYKIYEIEKYDFVTKLDAVRKYKRIHSSINDLQLLNNNRHNEHIDNEYPFNINLIKELGFSGKGARICILSSGFNTAHEAFDLSKILAAYDFVSRDLVVMDESGDPYGGQDEGTALLSVMAGFKQKIFEGAAFQAEYILAKTEDISKSESFTEDLWVAAIEWADSLGADIILTPLSPLLSNFADITHSTEKDAFSPAFLKVISTASKRGILLVSDAPQDFYNSMSGSGELHFFGNILLIENLDINNNRGFNYNNYEMPRLQSLPEGPSSVPLFYNSKYAFYAAEGGGNNFYNKHFSPEYGAAFTAAAAALLIEAHPNWNNLQILKVLKQTAIDNHADGQSLSTAHGFIDLFAAMNYHFPVNNCDLDGNGRIDGSDLALFALYFSKITQQKDIYMRADFDGNGTVDGSDLAILINRFSKETK